MSIYFVYSVYALNYPQNYRLLNIEYERLNRILSVVRVWKDHTVW